MTELLSDEQITDGLSRLPGWSRVADEIRVEYQGKDFPAAIAFVDALAQRAEAAGHHPDIDIRWNKVTLALSTHSAGGLTGKDLSLAGEISAIADRTGLDPVQP